jgi:hypothetical protein
MYEIPPSATPPEDLTKDVIQHLSKEIETTTNNMMAFRTRIGFGMFIGPFLLLSSFIVAVKGQHVSFTLSRWKVGVLVLAVVVDVICFVGIAYIASRIEAQSLKQCNRWRLLIAELLKSPTKNINWSLLNTEEKWKGKDGAWMAYVVGYFLLFVAVSAAVVIVVLGTPTSQNHPSSEATFRIEQVTPTPPPADRK